MYPRGDVEKVLGRVVALLLLLLLTAPVTRSTVMVFSIFDVFAELESWGRVTLGRFKGSGSASDWPIPEVTGHNSLTLEITELRLLDVKHQWVKSHHFDSSSRNFMVSDWQEGFYDGLKAHGRRIQTIRLGEVGGQITIAVYIFTEAGNLTRGDALVEVSRGDVQMTVELTNVTQGCSVCHDVDLMLGIWGRGDFTPLGSVTQLVMEQNAGTVTLPHMADLDGSWVDIVEDPTIKQLDTSVSVTVRIPTFRSSARYDVTVQPGGTAAEVPPGGGILSHKVYGVTEKTKPSKEGLTESKTRADSEPKYNHVKDTPDNARTNSGVAFPFHQIASTVLLGLMCLTTLC